MHKLIRPITDRLGVIFDPKSWLRQGKVSHSYDDALNDAMDKQGVIKIVNQHHGQIGNIKVWIANYPYAYGFPAVQSLPPYTLPRRATAKRIRRLILERLTND